MRGIVLYLLLALATFTYAVTFTGPTFDSINVCDVTAKSLKLLARQANQQRVLCEGHSFKSADCSNYWALAEELHEQSDQFQKCLNHQVSSFRSWLTGLDLSGGFVLQNAVGDRDKVEDTSSVTDAFSRNETATTDATFASSEHTKRVTLTSEVHDDASAIQTLTVYELSNTNALVSAEDSANRQQVDTQHATSLQWLASETSHVMSTEDTDATAERDDITTTTNAIIANIKMREAFTRSSINTNAATIRSVVSSESNTTRSEYDLQTEQVNATFQAANLNTRNVVISNITRDQSAMQDLESSTQDASRIEHGKQRARNVQEIDLQQQNVRSTLADSHSTQTSLTNTAETIAEATIQQATSDEAAQISSAFGSLTQTSVNAETAFASTIQATITAMAGSEGTTVQSQEAQTAALFNLLLSQTNFTQITTDEEELLFTTIFAHFHLCIQPNDPRTNFYLFEDIIMSRSIVWATIQFYQSKYGPSSTISSAVSFYNQGSSASDTRSAMSLYRQAYNAVMKATM